MNEIRTFRDVDNLNTLTWKKAKEELEKDPTASVIVVTVTDYRHKPRSYKFSVVDDKENPGRRKLGNMLGRIQ